VTAQEAWTAATVNGARALGLGERIGALAPGMVADLTGYRLSSCAFRPLNDPLRQLVYAESGADLSLVMVDGEIVMRDGRFTRFDEAALFDEIAAEHERLKPYLDAAEAGVSGIRQAYEAIYRRSLTHRIAEDTYPALFDAPPSGHRH
jgi:guanine deaminase